MTVAPSAILGASINGGSPVILPHDTGGTVTLEQVEARMRVFLHLPSTDHVRAALAGAVSAALDGPPLWMLMVGAPSSGKTEAIRALDDVADAKAKDITAPGLLGWSGSPTKGRATGLLTRIGDPAFATITDLSNLLATSDRGGREQVYGLLRDAYDGHVMREIGSAPHPLEWKGRLTLLAAVTPAVDSFASHANALGPRWLYFRMPEVSRNDRRLASVAARQNAQGLKDHRLAVRQLAARLIAQSVPRARQVVLHDDINKVIDDSTMVACLGRAAVERASNAAREITNVPVPEDSPRLAGQLSQLARALLGLGLLQPEAARLVRRAALDTIPEDRRRVLIVLAHGEADLSGAEIARRARLDRKVARFALQALAAVGICEFLGDEDDEHRRTPKPWRLCGEDARMIAAVIRADEVGRDVGSLHHSLSKEKQEHADPPHTSSRVQDDPR